MLLIPLLIWGAARISAPHRHRPAMAEGLPGEEMFAEFDEHDFIPDGPPSGPHDRLPPPRHRPGGPPPHHRPGHGPPPPHHRPPHPHHGPHPGRPPHPGDDRHLLDLDSREDRSTNAKSNSPPFPIKLDAEEPQSVASEEHADRTALPIDEVLRQLRELNEEVRSLRKQVTILEQERDAGRLSPNPSED